MTMMGTIWYILFLTSLMQANFGLIQRETYDFIIVGIGSAGSVVVNQLSSNPKYKVLALENGGYASFLSQVPAFAPFTYFTKNNYRYKMEKQANMFQGLKNERMVYSAGNGLGGTSLINFLMHVLPTRKVFDEWAQAGNTGWDAESMSQYVREFEKVYIPNPNLRYRGANGSLDVQEIPYKTGIFKTFLQGAQEMNMIINPDYNGERQQEGIGPLQATERNGKRCDTYTAFVKPIARRINLKMHIYSKVVRILIDPKTKEANGVIYFQFTTYRYKKAYSKKEVILCAGVFNSAKLLMLSGIGPKIHLESHNITVIQDLPVGELMQDHLTFPGLNFKAKISGVNLFTTVLNPINYIQLFTRARGPLTVPAFALEAVGFINTNVTERNTSDIELIFVSGSLNSDYGLFFRRFLGISKKVYNELFKSTEHHKTFTVLPMHYYPKSSGHVKLKSKNPFDNILITGNHYTDPERVDIRAMVAAIRFIQKLSKTPAFKKIGAEQVVKNVSYCKHTKLDSDEYWECLLKLISASLWHEVGTCKMGSENDKTSVVDPELKVKGIKGLRVVDNSIAPTIPGCHSNPLAIMIGFKGSELILKQYS